MPICKGGLGKISQNMFYHFAILNCGSLSVIITFLQMFKQFPVLGGVESYRELPGILGRLDNRLIAICLNITNLLSNLKSQSLDFFSSTLCVYKFCSLFLSLSPRHSTMIYDEKKVILFFPCHHCCQHTIGHKKKIRLMLYDVIFKI